MQTGQVSPHDSQQQQRLYLGSVGIRSLRKAPQAAHVNLTGVSVSLCICISANGAVGS